MLSNRALNTKNTMALASAGHRFKRLLLDALGEERCLLRIVGRGGVSSRSLCHFEWHAPFAQGFEKLRSCAADDMVVQLARCCVDGPYTKFPETFRGRPPVGCQQGWQLCRWWRVRWNPCGQADEMSAGADVRMKALNSTGCATAAGWHEGTSILSDLSLSAIVFGSSTGIPRSAALIRTQHGG